MNPPASTAPPLADTVPRRIGWRAWYLQGLTWAFMLLTAARLVAYAPTVWAIVLSRDSSQHSLWTWFTWLGANLTMAGWLYEQNGQRIGRAVIVNLGNATMCAAMLMLIASLRGLPV